MTVSILSFSRSFALAALGGSFLALVGFRLWIYLTDIFLGNKTHSKFFIFFIVLSKIVLLGFGLWWGVRIFSREPLAFLLGLSCIVTSIFLGAIKSGLFPLGKK